MPENYLLKNEHGIRQRVITEDDDPFGNFAIETTQRVGDVIADVARQREANQSVGHRKSRNLVPVAEIPMIVYQQALIEGWANDKKKWRAWINDPQNKLFRITDGRF